MANKGTRKSKTLCITVPEDLRLRIEQKMAAEGYKSLAAVCCRLMTTHPEMQKAGIGQ